MAPAGMDATCTPRFPIRLAVATSVTALWALSLAAPAAADPTRFEFTLTNVESHDITFPQPPVFDGRGFFVVDDPIPATGDITLVASDLSGVAGFSFNRHIPFGYAFGNTFDILVEPLGELRVIESPHNDALITFSNGVVVGISYHESHDCNTGPQCLPVSPAGNMARSTHRPQRSPCS